MVNNTPNPWVQLPAAPPYVVPADEPHITAFNELYAPDSPYYLDLSMPPEPVLGLHDAPVVLLSANPGRDPADPDYYYRQPGAIEHALKDSASADGNPVRLLTDEVANTPGGIWWRRIVGGLKSAGYEYEELSQRILVVEFHGYHSRKWSWLPITLPSQRYGFEIVRQAMERQAAIVILRAVRPWKIAVPELITYERLALTNSARKSAVSAGNMQPADFQMACDALTAG